MEPGSPALQVDSLPSEPPGKRYQLIFVKLKNSPTTSIVQGSWNWEEISKLFLPSWYIWLQQPSHSGFIHSSIFPLVLPSTYYMPFPHPNSHLLVQLRAKAALPHRWEWAHPSLKFPLDFVTQVGLESKCGIVERISTGFDSHLIYQLYDKVSFCTSLSLFSMYKT